MTQQAPDARADVFSLGAVLYALLAGDLWIACADLVPRIAADGTLDDALRTALLAAVAPELAARCPSVAGLQAALEAYLEQIWPGRTR